MCILIYVPSGSNVSQEDLFNACDNNPDGFGWANITQSPDGEMSITTLRTMQDKYAIDTFLAERERDSRYPALFHARIATHGTTDVGNCHPFVVGHPSTVLAHNGILDFVDAEGHRSDTRVFAEDWLPNLGVEILDDEDYMAALENACWGSKLVVLSVDPTLSKWAYIINEGLGHWHEGCWFSNHSYEPYYYRQYVSYSGVWGPPIATAVPRVEVGVGFCDFCNYHTQFTDTVCSECGMCNQCGRWTCNCVAEEARQDDLDYQEVYITSDGELLVLTDDGWRDADLKDRYSFHERHGCWPEDYRHVGDGFDFESKVEA